MNDNYRTINLEEILFAEYFQVFIENLDLIYGTPEYYNCRPKFMGFKAVNGSPFICLGNMFQIWSVDQFLRKCNCCGQLICVFHSHVLNNGTSFWKGICPNCRQIKSGVALCYEYFHSKLIGLQQENQDISLFNDYGNIKGLEFSELLQKLNLNDYLNMN